MIVGTIALYVMLFGGGMMDTFFVGELEKGVKEYVLDKERKDELSAEVKESKKYIKAYDKQRKAQLKQYKKLISSTETTREELEEFYSNLRTERRLAQNKLIDYRLKLSAKLTADEWNSIIALSKSELKERAEKAQAKEKKRTDKGKEEKTKEKFAKTRDVILNDVEGESEQERMEEGLDKLIVTIEYLDAQTRAINAQETATIARQNASREEMLSLATRMNGIRESGFVALREFQLIARDDCTEAEWQKVMKVFSKDQEISVR
jgi:hypothetical protein